MSSVADGLYPMSYDFTKKKKKLNIKFCPPRRMENGLNFTFSGSAGDFKKFWGWAGCAHFRRDTARTPHLHRLQVPSFSAKLH